MTWLLSSGVNEGCAATVYNANNTLTLNDQRIERDRTLKNIFVQLCAQAASVIESETIEIKGWCSNEKQLAEKACDSSSCLANAGGGSFY
jgi:hypothetical protein